MAISNDVLSSTLYSIRDEAVDELFRKTAFLDQAKRLGGIEYEDGGSKIQRPLILAEHSSTTQFVTGYEPMSLAVTDALRPAVYDWCDTARPVVITKKDELENSSDKAIVKILDVRFKDAMNGLRRDINTQILAGTSVVLTGMNTLNGVTNVLGFLEENAFGTGAQTNVVGGLSKATYVASNWNNQSGTASSAYGTNGLVVQDTLSAAIGAYGGETQLVIMSIAGFANYKRVLQVNERYVDQKMLDGGRMALAWNGAIVERDATMPVNTLGTDDVTAYFLDFKGIKLVIHSDADFAVSEMVSIPGTIMRQAFVYFKGQLVADHLASQGILIDGDTY
jgi:hypothetical protein